MTERERKLFYGLIKAVRGILELHCAPSGSPKGIAVRFLSKHLDDVDGLLAEQEPGDCTIGPDELPDGPAAEQRETADEPIAIQDIERALANATRLMRNKLSKRLYKGGWVGVGIIPLFWKMVTEERELDLEIRAWDRGEGDLDQVADEIVDMMNFGAMMLDNIGRIKASRRE